MIKVEIIKNKTAKNLYRAVVSDDKGHIAKTLEFPYGKIKIGLRKKNIYLPLAGDLVFDENGIATIVFDDRSWGKEV